MRCRQGVRSRRAAASSRIAASRRCRCCNAWHRARRRCAPAIARWPTSTRWRRPMPEPMPPLLSVRDLRVHFKVRDRKAWPWTPAATLKAVDGVSFDLRAGETLGIVGESGCGKSTLARACLNLIPATAGEVVWQGKALRPDDHAAWLAARRDIQIIF